MPLGIKNKILKNHIWKTILYNALLIGLSADKKVARLSMMSNDEFAWVTNSNMKDRAPLKFFSNKWQNADNEAN